MKIGGFLKQSLIDFPGNIASVIFTVGCNFRCFYCHNPELVLPEKIKLNELINESDILSYLNSNKSLLDAVVITGGEPTIHSDLPDFIEKIKALDLLVKLDTNGTNPTLLNNLLKRRLIDYLAFDIKSSLDLIKYREIVGEQFSLIDLNNIIESIQLVKNSVIDFEFRTTLVKPFHSIQNIQDMSDYLTGNYYLQEFNPSKILKTDIKNISHYDHKELIEISESITNDKIKLHLRTS